MDSDLDLSCPICHQEFNEGPLLPRMIPGCGHSFCSQCIQKMIDEDPTSNEVICPEEDAIQMKEQGILGFPKNFALIRLISKRQGATPFKASFDRNFEEKSPLDAEKSPPDSSKPTNSQTESIDQSMARKQSTGSSCSKNANNKAADSKEEQEGVCKSHQKKLDIICISDKCLVCTNCALFGDHKGHEVRPQEEALREIARRSEDMVNLFQKVEEARNYWATKQFALGIQKDVKMKEEEMIIEVNLHYDKLLDFLNSCRKNSIEELKAKLNGVEKSLEAEEFISPSGRKQVDLWIWEVQEKIKQIGTTRKNHEVALYDLMKPEMEGRDCLVLGGKYLGSLEKAKESLSEKTKRLMNEINMIPKKELFEKRHGSFVEIDAEMGSKIEKAAQEVQEVSFPGLNGQEASPKSLKGSPKSAGLDCLLNFDVQFARESIQMMLEKLGRIHESEELSKKVAMTLRTFGTGHVFVEEDDLLNLESFNLLDGNSLTSQAFNFGTMPPKKQQDFRESTISFGESPVTFAERPTTQKEKKMKDLEEYKQPTTPKSRSNSKNRTPDFNLRRRSTQSPAPGPLFDTNNSRSKTMRRPEMIIKSSSGFLMNPFNSPTMRKDGKGIPKPKIPKPQEPNKVPTPKGRPNVFTKANNGSMNSMKEKQKKMMDSKSPARHMSNSSYSEISESQGTLGEDENAIVLSENAKKLLKKRNQVTVSSKFEKTAKMIENDETEMADLTSSNLGDSGICALSPYLRASTNLVTLKLLKCKITDDGAAILLRALLSNESIQTLNLSLNSLGDKSLENTLVFASKQATIRIVYLNQNLITAKCIKSKQSAIKNSPVKIMI